MDEQQEFDAWLAAQSISLTNSQQDAAHALLAVTGQHLFLRSRQVGTSFLFRLLEEFLKSHPKPYKMPTNPHLPI